MTNQSDATKTLVLTLDAPSTITLTNSGAPGSNFSVGGSITLSSTTPDGTYSGTITITADYQ
jgi:spore coat protein U-like protein